MTASPALPCVQQVDRGVWLRVRVSPGASGDRLIGLHGDALKVSVSAPPEKGRANKAVCALVAKSLGLRKADVQLASGQTSHNKVIAIQGLDAAGLSRLLAQALGS